MLICCNCGEGDTFELLLLFCVEFVGVRCRKNIIDANIWSAASDVDCLSNWMLWNAYYMPYLKTKDTVGSSPTCEMNFRVIDVNVFQRWAHITLYQKRSATIFPTNKNAAQNARFNFSNFWRQRNFRNELLIQLRRNAIPQLRNGLFV